MSLRVHSQALTVTAMPSKYCTLQPETACHPSRCTEMCIIMYSQQQLRSGAILSPGLLLLPPSSSAAQATVSKPVDMSSSEVSRVVVVVPTLGPGPAADTRPRLWDPPAGVRRAEDQWAACGWAALPEPIRQGSALIASAINGGA